MVVRVWELACQSGADEVIVATDDERIGAACDIAGASWQLTRAEHASGTDRIAEVASRLGWPDEKIVVNLQGDEPGMPAANVAQVARLLVDATADLATLAVPIESSEEWHSSAVVKVVTDRAGRALYFSRAPIPQPRDNGASQPPADALRHLGLYSYRVAALKALTAQPPCALERTECLEQLRALWMGMTIQVAVAQAAPPPGVDTPADLAAMVRLFTRGG